MWHELQEEVELELAQLRALVESFHPLLSKTKTSAPDTVETVALAGFLHSFYTGIENVFKRVALHTGGALPDGGSWHTQLLDGMARRQENRVAVLSQGLHDILLDYLTFRHVFRHAYSFELQWRKMAPLVAECETTFRRLEQDMTCFLEGLDDSDAKRGTERTES